MKLTRSQPLEWPQHLFSLSPVRGRVANSRASGHRGVSRPGSKPHGQSGSCRTPALSVSQAQLPQIQRAPTHAAI